MTDCGEEAKRLDMGERQTVSIAETVDVTGVDDDTALMMQQMASLYEDLFRTFVEKNLDYGSSFIIGGELETQRDGSLFDDPQTANLYRLYTRIDDKNSRFYQRAFGDGYGRVEDEDIGETALDASNYWILIAWLLRHGNEHYSFPTTTNP